MMVLFTDTVPMLLSIDGGDQTAIPGVQESDLILQWTADSSGLYVTPEPNVLPLRIVVLDISTGEREPFLEVEPVDRAGVGSITSFRINPDGTAYAYSHSRIASELHLVEGLR
jgi:hypothetical protein